MKNSRYNDTTKVIAIIQTGQPIESVLKKYGDFDAWFIKAMAIDKARTKTFRVYEKIEFPEMESIAGLIITGSAAMVTEQRNWSEYTINWLKQFLHRDIPVLGVCYGHQQLARLLGGTVDWNPQGRQMGQVNMRISPEAYKDRLLGSIIEQSENSKTRVIKLLATHQQAVIELPDDVTILGTTELDENHCFRYKNHIWGLQFHPEFTTDITAEYIRARAKDLVKEGLNPVQMIKDVEKLDSVEHRDKGSQLLRRFRDICFFEQDIL
ncbi:MAG: glutamine amidotransferase [Alcanivoracaceae bacterium]|nr:glutamine amidotransferase [Alcanivoracaceae bacterium]